MNLDGVDGIEVLPGVHLPPAKGGLGAFEKVIHLAQPQSRGGGSTDESGGGGVGADVDLDNRPETPARDEEGEDSQQSTPRGGAGRPTTAGSARSARSAGTRRSRSTRKAAAAAAAAARARAIQQQQLERSALRWESPELCVVLLNIAEHARVP